MKYIHSLTGLRGLAAFIVFISHSANESMLPSIFGHGFGKVGVMMFFVLSGFLMAHLYVNEDFTIKNVKQYAIARIGRVVPLYLALILISIFISNVLYEDFCYRFVDLRTIGLAFSFIKAPSIFWTIPVEVQFYVVFLAFWLINKKFSKKPLVVVFILFSLLKILFLLTDAPKLPDFITLYSYAFLLGAVTALFYKHIRSNEIIHNLSSVLAIPLIVLLFINLPVLRERYGVLVGDSQLLNVWNDPITWGIIYALFICSLFNAKGLSFLNSKPFVFLGTISYGFYLIHYPVLLFFSSLEIHPILQLIMTFSTTTLLAHLSYNYFEVFMSRKIRGLSGC